MGSCTTHPPRGCSIGASCCARSWHCARRQGSPRPARVQGAAAACTAHWRRPQPRRVCQLPCVRARRGERAPSDRDGCEAVGRSAVQASAVPSAVQTDGALYTRAAHQLHHLCDDLEMRHKTSGLPGALVYEQCTALVAEHFGVLHGVLEAWPLICRVNTSLSPQHGVLEARPLICRVNTSLSPQHGVLEAWPLIDLVRPRVHGDAAALSQARGERRAGQRQRTLARGALRTARTLDGSSLTKSCIDKARSRMATFWA